MKKITMALVLLASTVSALPAMAQAADGAGCRSCGVMLAQADAPQDRIGRADAAVQIPGHPVPKVTLVSCCDPNMANNPIPPMFSNDYVGNITTSYGLKFNPTPGFRNAFQNTATIVQILAGTSGWLVVDGHMRTDMVANQAWPVGGAAAFWNAGTTTTTIGSSATHIYWEHTATGWQSPTATTPYPQGTMALTPPSAPHLKTNGTRYAVKLTYWLYYWKGHQPFKIQVICRDMREQYLGTIKNEQAFKMAAGAGDPQAGLLSSLGAPVAADRITLGREIALTPAEIAALPAEIRAGAR